MTAMKLLFIDNFRGFRNARIPIRQVNFLVGENSTGKTSVLGLLNIFSSPEFMFGNDFSNEHVNFGHFSDMVSAHSDDRTSFHIGLAWEYRERKHDQLAAGWLLTYREDQGAARLDCCTFFKGTEKLSLRFHNRTVYYRRTEYRPVRSAFKISGDMFSRWKEEHLQPERGYQKLQVPTGLKGRVSLYMALSLIWSDLETHKAKGKSKTKKAATEISLRSPEELGFTAELVWVAPIRTKPRRTYDEVSFDFSPEGEHTPYLIRRLLSSKSAAIRYQRMLRRIGRASGLFQDVRIKNFGTGSAAPFEVDVVLDGRPLNLTTVGYGVSQSLPVFVEVLARRRESWFAIQQPEVHLHPRAQAALGDLLFEMARRERKFFVVETHSDFTIDRFRLNYRRSKKNAPEAQILFFERKDRHNVVTAIRVGEAGELPSSQPEGYRKFFVKEQMRLLGL